MSKINKSTKGLKNNKSDNNTDFNEKKENVIKKEDEIKIIQNLNNKKEIGNNNDLTEILKKKIKKDKIKNKKNIINTESDEEKIELLNNKTKKKTIKNKKKDLESDEESIELSEKKDSLTLEQVHELLDIHLEYVKKLENFKNKTKCKLRYPNFPECISENLVKEYINFKEKRICNCSQTGGDLEVYEKNKKENIIKKIEVKCFTSNGPTSFGPTEKWDEIYFLDAVNFRNKNFKLYKLKLANNSSTFESMKINSTKDYKTVCGEGKRPRINFKYLYEQLEKDIELVYEGSFNFTQELK